jgi:hypothetical protein
MNHCLSGHFVGCVEYHGPKKSVDDMEQAIARGANVYKINSLKINRLQIVLSERPVGRPDGE